MLSVVHEGHLLPLGRLMSTSVPEKSVYSRPVPSRPFASRRGRLPSSQAEDTVPLVPAAVRCGAHAALGGRWISGGTSSRSCARPTWTGELLGGARPLLADSWGRSVLLGRLPDVTQPGVVHCPEHMPREFAPLFTSYVSSSAHPTESKPENTERWIWASLDISNLKTLQRFSRRGRLECGLAPDRRFCRHHSFFLLGRVRPSLLAQESWPRGGHTPVRAGLTACTPGPSALRWKFLGRRYARLLGGRWGCSASPAPPGSATLRQGHRRAPG